MKKTLAMLLVLALVAPAMAVTFTASDAGNGVLKIDYTLASGEALRGLALKLTRTSGDAVVAAGTDVTVAPFNTFIDFAFSNAGYQIGQGHPVANPAAAGVATLPASTFSISVGYLDQGGNQAGITTNGSITVKLTGTANSCFDIEMDTLRGGVVGDNVVAPAAGWKINQCVVFVTDCFDKNSVKYSEWVSVGKPDCWCIEKNPRQCKGDADGLSQGKQNYWVSTNDLNVLLAAWNKTYAQIQGQKFGTVDLICADFDHAAQGKQLYRVSTNDLNILLANWNVSNGPTPTCVE